MATSSGADRRAGRGSRRCCLGNRPSGEHAPIRWCGLARGSDARRSVAVRDAGLPRGAVVCRAQLLQPRARRHDQPRPQTQRFARLRSGSTAVVHRGSLRRAQTFVAALTTGHRFFRRSDLAAASLSEVRVDDRNPIRMAVRRVELRQHFVGLVFRGDSRKQFVQLRVNRGMLP